MSSAEYAQLDASALAALIRAGKASRAEVLQAALARISEKNPQINAVVEVYDEPVDDETAQGPFGGVPILLKDIGAGISGKRTRCASRALIAAPPRFMTTS